MGLFEFLMVLVSIIIGLGVAELLTGVARALRRRNSVGVYWVHLVLVLALFLALLQQWWEIWGLRDVSEWSFVALLIMLAAPVCLFLMAHLVFPEPVDAADFEEYYYGEMRPIWGLGAVGVVASTSFRPLVFGAALVAADNAASLIMLFGFLTLLTSTRRAVHATLVPMLVVVLLLDILWWSAVLGT